jgi:hypothetical protein
MWWEIVNFSFGLFGVVLSVVSLRLAMLEAAKARTAAEAAVNAVEEYRAAVAKTELISNLSRCIETVSHVKELAGLGALTQHSFRCEEVRRHLISCRLSPIFKDEGEIQVKFQRIVVYFSALESRLN